MPIQMLAAIDVGSSEVAMKIYQFSKRTGIQEVEYVRSMVELGADTYNTGIISYDTARELCGVLGGFVDKLKEYRIEKYVAYAGSAMREAATGIWFWIRFGCIPGWMYRLSEMRAEISCIAVIGGNHASV